jgi:hypothetical protein
MTADRDTTRIVRSWLRADEHESADRVLETVLSRLDTTPQRRPMWPPRRFAQMNKLAQAGIAAAAVLVVAVLGYNLLPRIGGIGGPPTPGPTAVPTAAVLGVGGTRVSAGSYTTQFQPALTLTIGNVVALDCVAGDGCTGRINVNEPAWLDLEFGKDHGSEFMAIRLEKVYDPGSAGTLIDPPEDLAAWITTLPGTAELDGPKAVSVGGLAASQFDVRTPGDISFGLIPGNTIGAAMGPTILRVIVLRVDGHLVLILEGLGPHNTAGNGQAALDSLQPLVDSISWK